jgi:hypothetical protein
MQRRYHGELDGPWLPQAGFRTRANEREPVARAILSAERPSRVALGPFLKGCRVWAVRAAQIRRAKSHEREQNVPPA